ncbi:hypothetical protein [Spirosoma agri]|uniref:Uncharacterized protein n=1 Tax=Spirosoma agri TaxID=1987381 RepID=A0A6M0IKT7_9BACT|nr:hypothetical protein [Spirosoma agri]NEU68265.1 hypothetical protein [Spirosoma agri]
MATELNQQPDSRFDKTVTLTLNNLTPYLITSLSRIEATSLAAAMKSTRILAHLRGEDEEAAKAKVEEEINALAKDIAARALKILEELSNKDKA